MARTKRNTNEATTNTTIETQATAPEKVTAEVVQAPEPKEFKSLQDALAFHEAALSESINEMEGLSRKVDSVARKMAYHLYTIDKEKLYNASDISYKGIGDYALEKFNLKKSTVSEAINTFKRFGSLETHDIADQYKDYRWSALIAMKGMSDDEIEGAGITADDTRDTVKEKYKTFDANRKLIADKRSELVDKWNKVIQELQDADDDTKEQFCRTLYDCMAEYMTFDQQREDLKKGHLVIANLNEDGMDTLSAHLDNFGTAVLGWLTDEEVLDESNPIIPPADESKAPASTPAESPKTDDYNLVFNMNNQSKFDILRAIGIVLDGLGDTSRSINIKVLPGKYEGEDERLQELFKEFIETV